MKNHFRAVILRKLEMEKFFVAEAKIGKGVFARAPLEPRETIFFVSGRLIDYDAARSHPTGQNSFQVGLQSYIYPLSPSSYLNHSCSPNAGLTDDIRVIALRQIAPGEEIVFDYSTSMLERDWELDCLCGSPQCRGRIRDFDRLPRSLQSKYISLGIVQKFILDEIRAPSI